MTRHATTIRRSIERWVQEQMREQGKPWYRVDRSGWPQCPLVNPQCPEDLCILPAGHDGTVEGYHVLGTTSYHSAYKYPLDWMMPEGTTSEVLIEEGRRRRQEMFPDE
jgi:hypothetical protein